MKVKIKRNCLELGFKLLGAAVLLVFIASGLLFSTGHVIGAANITNVTVFARVNITNTEPNITSVIVNDNVSTPASEIDLNPNMVTPVWCNATVFDYNGWQDINPNATNATFYIESMGRDGDTDNNYRYRNESCKSCRQAVEDEAPAGVDLAYYARCDCKFAIQYYANYSDSWKCNITVRDLSGTAQNNRTNFTDTAVSPKVTVTKLLALDTSTYLIDYGNLSVTQTSEERINNITNFGNVGLNLTLRGYGGINESSGINYTMVCSYGNISWGHQRYHVGSEYIENTDFDTMINLTNSTVLTNLSLPQRLNDADYANDKNSTVWRINIPLSVGGICNGTIIFGAIEDYQE